MGCDAMNLSILLLALSLSIDALGMGMAYGMRGISLHAPAKLIISIQSALITGAALFMGSAISGILPAALAEKAGIIILIAMGVIILAQGAFKAAPLKSSKKNETVASFIIKSLGITIQIIRTPHLCDFDNSKKIDSREALYLGLALSLDSLGAGLGGGAAGLFVPALPFLAALCQIFFLTLGAYCGKKLASVSRINSNVWTMLSGFMLIALGILRL